MNRKIIAIIIAVMLLIISAVIITSCNKDDTTTTSPSTENVASTEENPSGDVTENTAENETKAETDNSESAKDDKIDKDESTTGIESQPPGRVEQTSDKNEPETCKTCGNIVVPDSYKGEMIIGEYCDGMCNEWYGEMDF